LSNVALILLSNANDVCFGGGRKLWQVFGMRKLYWFLPLYADDDLRQMTVLQGLDYPLRLDMDGQEF
jgi:palmitoyltransferase